MKSKETKKTNIVIYRDKNRDVSLRADVEKETIWATQDQIADVFDTTKQNISQHLKSIFKSGELTESSVVKDFFTTAKDGKNYKVKFYNLDAVIAVGYRVNSKQATGFRIWATKTLRDYILKGYAINEKRLLEVNDKFRELQTTIAFLEQKSKKELLSGQEGEILNLLASYAKTLTILNEYDKGDLKQIKGTKGKFKLSYEDCVRVIGEIKKELIAKKEAGELFGNERDGSFGGIIKGLYQTFGGKELYTTLESKAAHLLYFIIKDHPFSDGNKRVGSFLFVYFLDRQHALYRKTGERKINDNALVALALLIAESDPNEKNTMIALVTQLIS